MPFTLNMLKAGAQRLYDSDPLSYTHPQPVLITFKHSLRRGEEDRLSLYNLFQDTATECRAFTDERIIEISGTTWLPKVPYVLFILKFLFYVCIFLYL